MIAYHGDAGLKEGRIARVRKHRLADQLVKAVGWRNGKGCAVGCTLRKYDHSAYETELGIPQAIARLEDAIFEGLPNAKAMMWPEKFLSAIKPGADLSLVFPRFIYWLLVDPKDGVIKYAKGSADCVKVIRDVADLYARWVKTGKPPTAADAAAARAAARSARSAAWSARSAAADAAVWSAADAAASSWEDAWDEMWSAAARSARSAADAAAWAVGTERSAGTAMAYRRQADKLLELLRQC